MISVIKNIELYREINKSRKIDYICKQMEAKKVSDN